MRTARKLWGVAGKMVKLFEIVLDAPPSPRGFLSGSELTGKLVVEVDETKS